MPARIERTSRLVLGLSFLALKPGEEIPEDVLTKRAEARASIVE
jgi:hypothetical protein